MPGSKLPSFIDGLAHSLRGLGKSITDLLELCHQAERELAKAIDERQAKTDAGLFADLLEVESSPENEAEIVTLQAELEKVKLFCARGEAIYAVAQGKTVSTPTKPVPTPPAPSKVNGNGEELRKSRDLLEAARLGFASIADVKDAIRRLLVTVDGEENWTLVQLLDKTVEKIRVWRGILRDLRVHLNGDEQDWPGLVGQLEKQVRRGSDQQAELDLWTIMSRAEEILPTTRDALDSMTRSLLSVITPVNVDGPRTESAARKALPQIAKELSIGEDVGEDADSRQLGLLARKRLAQLQKAANAKPATEVPPVVVSAELSKELSFGQKDNMTLEEVFEAARKATQFVKDYGKELL